MSDKRPLAGPSRAPETHSDPATAPSVFLWKYLSRLARGVHSGGVLGFLESVNAARTSACATRSGLQKSFRGLGGGCFLLSQPRALQNIGQRVIRFVTGVFIHVFVGAR